MPSQELKTIKDYFEPAFSIVGQIQGSKDQSSNQSSPLIFSSPHSGRIYPPSFLKASRLSAKQLRSSEDAYVDELFSHVGKQGARLIRSLVPRAYLDLNRHPHELDPKLFVGQLPAFARSDTMKVKNGLGVIARIVSEGREIYRRPLDLDEIQHRIKHLYYPYHAALHSLIDDTRAIHQRAILIDCHSMPSNNLPAKRNIPPDFVLGNLFDKSCDYELTHMVRSTLQSMGYIVAVNRPYAGGYVTKSYGKPQSGVHVLQIEISRRLYLDERSLEKTRGFHELRNNLRLLTKKMIEANSNLSPGTSLAAE